MSEEHWLIRRARTLEFSYAYPLQHTVDQMFIGGIQEIGLYPKSYTMTTVTEMVKAYEIASRIAAERTEAARKVVA